jgi:hypothetical protein
MGGSTNREIATTLNNPEAARATKDWAHAVCRAHEEAKQLQFSFSPAELYTADLIAPKENIIFSAGDPTSMVLDLPATIETKVMPELLESTIAPQGIRFVAANIRKLE